MATRAIGPMLNNKVPTPEIGGRWYHSNHPALKQCYLYNFVMHGLFGKMSAAFIGWAMACCSEGNRRLEQQRSQQPRRPLIRLRLPLPKRCGLGRLNLPDASDHDPMAEGAAARLDATLAFVSTAAIMVSLEAQAAQ
jgi:hypothetical protein